jgi:phosphotransferase system HPr-like phosphotransfer protein
MMADDRDLRIRRTPPAGVQEQIAPPTPVWSEEDTTPPPEGIPEALARIGRRQKVTQQGIDRIGDLRQELGGRIGNLERRVDRLADTSAHTGAVVAETAGKVDGMDSKVDLLTDLVKNSLDAQSQILVTRATAAIEITKTQQVAAVEVRKTQEIAVIDEGKDRRAARRQLAIRIVTALGAMWGTISALLLAHGC